jgi:hypothetical protein
MSAIHVTVLTDLRRDLPVLDLMQQHHLPADESPRHVQLVAEVEERVPQLVDRRRQGGQLDHYGVNQAAPRPG